MRSRAFDLPEICWCWPANKRGTLLRKTLPDAADGSEGPNKVLPFGVSIVVPFAEHGINVPPEGGTLLKNVPVAVRLRGLEMTFELSKQRGDLLVDSRRWLAMCLVMTKGGFDSFN